MKKCLFTKSTDNLNTVVTITTDLGPVTVYLSDEVLDKTLREVSTELTSLIENAKNLAETFNFDLIEAINKGGVMSMGSQQPAVSQPVYQAPQESFRRPIQQPIQQQPVQQPPRQRSTGAPIVLRNQEIPVKNSLQAAMAKKSPGQQTVRQPPKPPQSQIIENEMDAMGALLNGDTAMDNPYMDYDSISESVSAPLVSPIVPGNKKQVLQRVQTPTGRVFDIPASISDENGTTEITINTKNSSAEFEKKRKQIDEASRNGRVVSTNGYNEKVCPFCKGKRKINEQPCPKCAGEGTVIL